MAGDGFTVGGGKTVIVWQNLQKNSKNKGTRGFPMGWRYGTFNR